ncbi:DUF6461 domain-containing protein [Streptomyces arboris]|uniref:DUF6461 domain-containing protein n=1 Tax=Streptomyces arboris TaxID=2600619 RepID=UPI003BF5CBA9
MNGPRTRAPTCETRGTQDRPRNADYFPGKPFRRPARPPLDLSAQGEEPGELALAEKLSGVRVTAEMLASAFYTRGYFGQLPAVYRDGSKAPSPRPDTKTTSWWQRNPRRRQDTAGIFAGPRMR